MLLTNLVEKVFSWNKQMHITWSKGRTNCKLVTRFIILLFIIHRFTVVQLGGYILTFVYLHSYTKILLTTLKIFSRRLNVYLYLISFNFFRDEIKRQFIFNYAINLLKRVVPRYFKYLKKIPHHLLFWNQFYVELLNKENNLKKSELKVLL